MRETTMPNTREMMVAGTAGPPMVALIQFLKEGSTRISTPSRVPEPMQARPPCQLTRFQKRPSSIATATPGRKAPTMVEM